MLAQLKINDDYAKIGQNQIFWKALNLQVTYDMIFYA